MIDPKPGNDNWNKIYILLKDRNKNILAFGRIHDVYLEFMGKGYNIFGIATLVAVVKGRGYGRKVLEAQFTYAKNKGKTAIGFCNNKLTTYYQKNGLGIIVNGTKKFLYKDDNGKLLQDKWGGGDVIYCDGGDKLIEKIISKTNEKVIMYRQHW